MRTFADALGAPAPRVVPAALLAPVPPARAVMRGSLLASNAKARAELGWAPTRTCRRWIAEVADGLAAPVAGISRPGGRLR